MTLEEFCCCCCCGQVIAEFKLSMAFMLFCMYNYMNMHLPYCMFRGYNLHVSGFKKKFECRRCLGRFWSRSLELCIMELYPGLNVC